MSDIDLSKYRRHVDHLDMPDREKDELLLALWRIMESFVDRAFGDDPASHLRNGAEHGVEGEKSDPVGKMAIEDASRERGVVELAPSTETEKTPGLAGSFRATSADDGGRKR